MCSAKKAFILFIATFLFSSADNSTIAQIDTKLSPSEYLKLNEKAEKLYAKALETYQPTDFKAARKPLEKVVKYNPIDGKNWIRLADCRFYTKNYSGAIRTYDQARKMGYGFLGNYRFMNLSIAASYALMDSTQQALKWLERSLQEERFTARSRLPEFDFFATLKENKKFKKLVGQALPEGFVNATKGWRYDLDYLISEIKRLNAIYSRQSLPDSIEQAAHELRENIPTLSDSQIWVKMQQLLAKMGQSHNSVWHFEGANTFDITQLPVTFYLFSDGLYIIDAKNKKLIGAKVEQIGRLSASDALKNVTSVVTSETPMKIKWLGPVYLRMPQVLNTLGIITNPTKASLILQTRDGKTKKITLNPVPVERREKLFASKLPEAKSPPLYLSKPDVPYWFKRIPESNLVYFQFNQIVNAEDESISNFASRLLDSLKQNNDKNLVVDLRRNNGGNTFAYGDLLRTLIWFDMKEKTKLFVIIGRNTYSAAQNLAVDLERLTDATFVGERSRGRPNTHGDESQVILPYSGLTVGLSSAYWQQSHPRDERRWIAPDVPVELDSKEYFANKDPILEAIKSILTK